MAWAGSGLLLTTASEALPDPLCLICLQLTSSTSPRPQSSLRCQEATPPWKCPSHSTHTQPLLQLWPFFYQPCPHPPSHNAPLSSRLAKAPACFFSLCRMGTGSWSRRCACPCPPSPPQAGQGALEAIRSIENWTLPTTPVARSGPQVPSAFTHPFPKQVSANSVL